MVHSQRIQVVILGIIVGVVKYWNWIWCHCSLSCLVDGYLVGFVRDFGVDLVCPFVIDDHRILMLRYDRIYLLFH